MDYKMGPEDLAAVRRDVEGQVLARGSSTGCFSTGRKWSHFAERALRSGPRGTVDVDQGSRRASTTQGSARKGAVAECDALKLGVP